MTHPFAGLAALVLCTSCSPSSRPPVDSGDAGASPGDPSTDDGGGDSDVVPPVDIDSLGIDLVIEAVVDPPAVEPRYFDADSCWIGAGCAGAPGLRTMLDFTVRVANRGADALPAEGLLEGSPCFVDGRLIFDFLGWRLLDPSGAPVAQGTLATACIEDASGGGAFTCALQGLSPGASDVQPRGATCHTADVSAVAGGGYDLEITVNPTGVIPETELANNTITVPVTLPDAVCEALACDGICCPGPCEAGVCLLPDLTADVPTLVQTAWIQEVYFYPDDCAVYEGCIDAPGRRRILRFATASTNLGNADLVLGDPSSNPEMEFSACHNHFHYTGFADYRLLGSGGAVAALGHKQSFCLVDTERISGDRPPQFDCDYQGITVGWADVYPDSLDCQWVDVTDVAPGSYDLRVQVNPNGAIRELDYTNNTASIPVSVPADPRACVAGPEQCGDGRDGDCDGAIDEGCAPLSANTTCAAAHPVGAGGSFVASLGGGAGPISACGGAGPAAYFALTLPAPEIVYLATYGSGMDTVLSIRPGCGGSEKACNDDACGSAQSAWAGELVAGTYIVAVKAKSAAAAGTVQLTVERAGCAGAQPLPASGFYAGATSGASRVRSACTRYGGAGPEAMYWFTTCPGETSVGVSTCGLSSFDTEVEIRQGGCNGVVHRGACNDDAWSMCPSDPAGSQFQADLAAPDGGDGLWLLIIDGQSSGDAGAFGFSMTFD